MPDNTTPPPPTTNGEASTTSKSKAKFQQVLFTGHHAYIITIAKLCKDAGKFTDVLIQCQDGDIKAHRLVLAACSPFLSKTFLSLPEGLPEFTLMIPNIRKEIVSTLIDFLYTGKMKLSRSNTWDLQQLVHILQIDPDNVRIESNDDQKEKRLMQSKITGTLLGVKINPVKDHSSKKEANSKAKDDDIDNDKSKSVASEPLSSTKDTEDDETNPRIVFKRRASQEISYGGKESRGSVPSLRGQPRTRGRPRGRMESLGIGGGGGGGGRGGLQQQQHRSGLETGYHDMANVETWVCAICGEYDPPITPSSSTEKMTTEWIGCDCNRWFHQYCTKLKTWDESFACSKVKLKCLNR